MAINDAYCCAKEFYDLRRDEETHHLFEAVPAMLGPGIVHAFEFETMPTEAGFLPRAQRAVCGCFVKVVYPAPFETKLALSCSDCVHWLGGTNRHVDDGPGFTLSPEARAALDRQRSAGE